jgi:hypothetical protein
LPAFFSSAENSPVACVARQRDLELQHGRGAFSGSIESAELEQPARWRW